MFFPGEMVVFLDCTHAALTERAEDDGVVRESGGGVDIRDSGGDLRGRLRGCLETRRSHLPLMILTRKMGVLVDEVDSQLAQLAVELWVWFGINDAWVGGVE